MDERGSRGRHRHTTKVARRWNDEKGEETWYHPRRWWLVEAWDRVLAEYRENERRRSGRQSLAEYEHDWSER